ncbi:MAG: hypothetical protein OXG37_07455 [Actinomycetia bacterium]|nr:hypothetical protein [Actinomycetes bacterium]
MAASILRFAFYLLGVVAVLAGLVIIAVVVVALAKDEVAELLAVPWLQLGFLSALFGVVLVYVTYRMRGQGRAGRERRAGRELGQPGVLERVYNSLFGSTITTVLTVVVLVGIAMAVVAIVSSVNN